MVLSSTTNLTKCDVDEMHFHWIELCVDKVFRGCMEVILLQGIRLACGFWRVGRRRARHVSGTGYWPLSTLRLRVWGLLRREDRRLQCSWSCWWVQSQVLPGDYGGGCAGRYFGQRRWGEGESTRRRQGTLGFSATSRRVVLKESQGERDGQAMEKRSDSDTTRIGWRFI